MRLIFLTAAFLAGCLYQNHIAPQNPAQLEIKGVAWCLDGKYDSLKAYDQTKTAVPHSMVDVHSKGVTVYVRCGKD